MLGLVRANVSELARRRNYSDALHVQLSRRRFESRSLIGRLGFGARHGSASGRLLIGCRAAGLRVVFGLFLTAFLGF